MPTVSIQDVAPGSILGSNVRDPLGRLLIAAGTALTERHLATLGKWGIFAVDIKDAGEGPKREVTPERLEKARANLKDRFRYVDLDHPFMSELFRECVEREARAMSAEEDRG